MSTTPPPVPAKEKGLKISEYIGYALGDMASNLFFVTFNIFLIYYYVDVWAIPAAAISTMMLVTRLWDAVNDPLMGLIADRTNTRWGKFRPYLLWGAIPYGFCGYLMFAGPDLGATGKLVYAYLTYTLMLMAYTVINVPYSSMLGVISPSSHARRGLEFPVRRRLWRRFPRFAPGAPAGEGAGRRRRSAGIPVHHRPLCGGLRDHVLDLFCDDA